MPKHVILYDGVCALCNGFVRFVLPKDKTGIFEYASLQSNFAHRTMATYGKDASKLEAVCVIENKGLPDEKALSKSDAILFILEELGGPWHFFSIFSLWPQGFRDGIYDLIARNRYKVFGRYETCLMPDMKYKNRFIEL